MHGLTNRQTTARLVIAERTVDKLWKLCGTILGQFTESECRNYFQHCGYRHTYNQTALADGYSALTVTL